MIIKEYNVLPDEAVRIRTEVFVKEQGFTREFDDIDNYAVHLVAFENGRATAACRFYWDKERSSYIVGRIAVLKSYRGRNIGSAILREAEKKIKELGGMQVFLLAQERAESFYKKQDYYEVDKHCYDEFCPHVWMKKVL